MGAGKVSRRTALIAGGAVLLGGAGLAGYLPLSSRREPASNPGGIPMADKNEFWPHGARLAVSVSMQFEAGAQPERGAESPFPPLDPKYQDLPAQTWYVYGVK